MLMTGRYVRYDSTKCSPYLNQPSNMKCTCIP